MAEYIDRELIVKQLKSTIINPQTSFINNVLIGLLEKAPTADVVEVVRCKDCIHLKNDTEYCKTHNKYYCELEDALKNLTYYCASGERKPKETVSLVDGHIDKSNKCVSCGTDIPEGTWTCPSCDRRWE